MEMVINNNDNYKYHATHECLFFNKYLQTACVHASIPATRAAADPLKLRMRAKLIGYKSCGAVWQQSASLTRCRGRTGEPHTQVIGMTCSWLTTSAVCLGVRGSVFATLRADVAVTVGWRKRRKWRKRR